MLPVLLVAIIVLGIFGLFLQDKSGRGYWVRRRAPRSIRSQSSVSQDLPLLKDSPWPELCFVMDVGNARFNGMIMTITALIIGPPLGYLMSRESTHLWEFLVFTVLIGGMFVYGIITLLSSIPRWQSCIVLEAERLVIYPTFGRPPRIVNDDQICSVGTQARSIAVLIRYYPLDYGGQIELTRLCQMNLPSTQHNDGLRLVLQARLAGPPNHHLEFQLLSKMMFRGFALLAIVWGVALLALAFQPGNQGRLELALFGVVEIFLVLIALTIGWPMRRK